MLHPVPFGPQWRVATPEAGAPVIQPMPEYLGPEEVADRMKVTRRTVYNWMRSGELPAKKIARTWRVKSSDLEGKGP